jgi:hypothetical protein
MLAVADRPKRDLRAKFGIAPVASITASTCCAWHTSVASSVTT